MNNICSNGIVISQNWQDDPRQAIFDSKVLGRLQHVLEFWRSEGYEVVPLPWLAPPDAMAWTRPENAMSPEPATHEGALVASGEQSFLWLDNQGLLPFAEKGYIGWTPCFRHEPKYDRQHHHYFMKAELFIPVDPVVALDKVHYIVQKTALCWRAMAMSEGRRDVIPETVHTSKHSVDLLVEGVELGSFGIRRRMDDNLVYVYGTALAEPRWSNTWPK